jgi:hypothetical protein
VSDCYALKYLQYIKYTVRARDTEGQADIVQHLQYGLGTRDTRSTRLHVCVDPFTRSLMPASQPTVNGNSPSRDRSLRLIHSTILVSNMRHQMPLNVLSQSFERKLQPTGAATALLGCIHYRLAGTRLVSVNFIFST